MSFISNPYIIQLPVFPQEIYDQIPWFSTNIKLNSMITVTHTEATIGNLVINFTGDYLNLTRILSE